MEITTYQGLDLVTTVTDEANVFYLLDEKGKRLICDDCIGSSFKVKVLIEAEVVLSVAQDPPYQAVMHSRKTESVTAIRVLECANCHCKTFVREIVPEEEKKGKGG